MDLQDSLVFSGAMNGVISLLNAGERIADKTDMEVVLFSFDIASAFLLWGVDALIFIPCTGAGPGSRHASPEIARSHTQAG